MEHLSLASFKRATFVVIAAIAFLVLAPRFLAQQEHAAAGSPEAAWSSIQQLVQSLESAVQSENLHAIHEPSMKIRAPIRSLKQHCSVLSVDIGQKMTAALKQLDNSITDLHSAADEGNQKEAESSLKEVQAAFDQLKSLDPDTAFKSVVH